MCKPTRSLIALLALAGSNPLWGSVETAFINSTIQELYGTTRQIAVGSSGTTNNTNSWTQGVVGLFGISIGGVQRYLSVSATNPTGVMTTNDSLMVVRTESSQGLTDTGSLTLYFLPGVSDANYTIDITFRFWSDAAMTNAVNPHLRITSLDVDFDQRFMVQDGDFNNYRFYTNTSNTPTRMTASAGTETYTGYTQFQGSGDSSFATPLNAVSFEITKHEINLGFRHNKNAYLAMFEFATPSNNLANEVPLPLVVVPEPSMAGSLAALVALLAARRRTC